MGSAQEERMKCPKCGWFSLRETEGGVDCKTCGYKLSAGEADKYRLFRLLRDESKGQQGTRGGPGMV